MALLVSGIVLLVSACGNSDTGTGSSKKAEDRMKVETGAYNSETAGYSIVTNGFSADLQHEVQLTMTLQVPQEGPCPPMITIRPRQGVSATAPMKNLLPAIKSVLQNVGEGHVFESEKVTANSVELEYTATLNNPVKGSGPVRFYAKFIRDNQYSYVLTTYAPQAQWNAVSKQLKSTVNSFALEK